MKLFRKAETSVKGQYQITYYATGWIILAALLIIIGIIAMIGIPYYNVWQQEMAGKAEMAKAEQNRRILVEEAKARKEAAIMDAQAEVERAIGMAKAMEIENGKLTSTYNQYLFIRNLPEIAQRGSMPQFIYIPSEGMLPIMDLDKSKK